MMENLLKNSLSDFIEERLLESYNIASNLTEYKKDKNKYIKLENTFLSKLDNENLIEDYNHLKDRKSFLDTLELEESYKIGFKDCLEITKCK